MQVNLKAGYIYWNWRVVYNSGGAVQLTPASMTSRKVFQDAYISYIPERILAKFYVDLETGCWVWTGSRTRDSYGWVWFKPRAWLAHRLVYELCVGPIPEGLQIDHLCRNRPCVSPSHLEPVTNAENVRRGMGGEWWRRKTHCPQGHAYVEANTYMYRNRRHCRACIKIRSRNWRETHAPNRDRDTLRAPGRS